MSSTRTTVQFYRPPFELLTPDQFDEIWSVLKHAIDQVHAHNAGSLSFEALYRYSYNLVVSRYGPQLYRNVSATLEEHLSTQTARLTAVDETFDDLSFLRELVDFYEDYKTTAKIIADIFMYLDRTYCRPQRRIPLYLLAIDHFRVHLLSRHRILQRMIDAMLAHILRDRQRNPDSPNLDYEFDARLMKRLILMLTQADPQVTYHTGQGSEHLQDSPDKIRCDGRFYRTVFEDPFLRATVDFFSAESQEAITILPLSEFVCKAEVRFRQEEDRARLFLDSSTFPLLQDRLVMTWVVPHAATLIMSPTKGCAVMFNEKCDTELRQLYMFLSRAPTTLAEMRAVMETYIVNAVDTLLRDNRMPGHSLFIVTELLQLKIRFFYLVHTAFFGDPEFLRTLQTAFKTSMNRDSRVAQYLSLSLDSLLRKQYDRWESSHNFSTRPLEQDTGDVASDSRSLDTLFSDHISLFRFLEDKDIFENFYRGHLAKRLLCSRSVDSDEAEQKLINYLKSECGHAYTFKIEGMLRDVASSKKLDHAFQRSLLAVDAQDYNDENDDERDAVALSAASVLNVSVLTSAYWPLDTATLLSVNVCPSLSAACQMYQKFYHTRHNGRKLTWLLSQGTGVIRGTFSQCTLEFILSTVQMLILLLFNDAPSLSYGDILKRINPSNIDDFKCFFLPLFANPKLRLLTYSPVGENEGTQLPSPAITEENAFLFWNLNLRDKFEVNDTLNCRLSRLRVPMMLCPKLETPGAGECQQNLPLSTVIPEPTPALVEEERRVLTDAAIVRVMKCRKTLKQEQLFVEVTQLLKPRFVPKPSLIKARVGHLIEREFLSRSSLDLQTYTYIA